MRSRRAFALVEFLVALALGSALAGLLLPAVQKLRESAARAQCQNNLKQLGLAVHGYESANNKLPPSTNRIPGEYKSWVVYLLPHIEQNALAQKYATGKDWFDPANQPLVGTTLKVMQCPSAPAPRVVTVTAADGKTFPAATGDYAIHEQIDTAVFLTGMLPLDYSRRALFASQFPATQVTAPTVVRGPTVIADCTDGLSNTLMLSEEAGRPQHWRAGKRLPGDLDIATPKTNGAWAATLGSLNIQPTGHSFDGTLRPGPCAVNCENNMGVYSFHAGNANVCFGDGSVRSVNANLNIMVFFSLSTSQGGEVINAGDY